MFVIEAPDAGAWFQACVVPHVADLESHHRPVALSLIDTSTFATPNGAVSVAVPVIVRPPAGTVAPFAGDAIVTTGLRLSPVGLGTVVE
jgi:hypothetical protein